MQRNEKGYRIGQDHHNAKLLNGDVHHILALWQDGVPIADIARRMECSMRYVYYIINGQRRGRG